VPVDPLSAAIRLSGTDSHYQRGSFLHPFQVFILRAIVGVAFAVVIARTFYPHTELFKVIGLAIIIVGLAYFAEYLRNRRRK